MLDVYRESKSKHRLRGIGIFFLSRRKMFSHFPNLLVFSHWHSDTVTVVLGIFTRFPSPTHASFRDTRLSRQDVTLTWSETQQKMKNEKHLSRWKTDSFIAMFCIGIQVAASFFFLRQTGETNWKINFSIFTLSGREFISCHVGSFKFIATCNEMENVFESKASSSPRS